MGQQLSSINLKASDATSKGDTEFTYDTIVSRSGNENIHLFSCVKALDGMTTSSIGFDQISSTHIELIKQIQKHLSLPTHVADVTKINSEIDKILLTNVFPPILARYRRAIEEIITIMKKQQQLTLNISLKQKLEENENIDQSISEESFDDRFSEDIDTEESNVAEQKLEQVKYLQQVNHFAIQSLTSLLMILIKSVEKNDPTFVQQLLTLAKQLCDQIPMNFFASSESSPIINKYWFKSLQPLTNYINELSLSENLMVANKALEIQLNFSIAKESFKDILPILRKFIFSKVHIYNVRCLFVRLNNSLIKTLNKKAKKEQHQNTDDDTTDYLKRIGAFPNSRLIQLDEKEFTGPYIASVVLAHIDFYNRINSIKQFEHGSIDSSISFEFHPNTFEELFHIIEQLTSNKINDSNIIVTHILTVCLRLFTIHLKFLCTAISTIEKDLLITNDELRKTVQISSTHIDLTTFVNDNQLKLWFDLLLKLSCNDNENFEQIIISQEASQALIYILEIKSSSFTEKLSFFHKYIIENKYPILIEQLFKELNQNLILLSWIEVFSNDNSSEKTIASTILYSFIDIYLNNIDLKQKEQIKQVLILFQELLLIRLISPSKIENNLFYISQNFIYFLTDYFIHILNISIDNDLLNSIFVGLCLMTNTDQIFNFTRIQPIFTTILPILVEYLLKDTIYTKNNIYSLCWLIGKMSNIMIIGPEQNLLEMKYIDKLKSPLFTGGCENIIIEKNKYLLDLYESNLAIYSQFNFNNQSSLSDNEFLMSIYNNIDQGAQLISKMKIYIEDKQNLLKSIEEQANDACAALFAVYVKHYRRIDLAKRELSRMDNEKPHNKLLSIYECANDVKILFATTKAQGGNLDELYKEIKINSLFLILNIKETNLIPIIEEDLSSSLTNIQSKKRLSFRRQVSQWSKAKYVLRLLHNTMQACIRFKKIILNKKQVKLNLTIENSLNRIIDAFV